MSRGKCGTPQGGWCGLCYANVRKRGNYKGHRGYVRPRKPYIPPVWERENMRKPEGQGKGGESEQVPARGDLFAGLPLVFEHITCGKYDDGTKRKRSTILLIADGGIAKVCLSDGDMGRNGWAAGETWEAALAILEEQLATGVLSWQEKKEAPAKNYRK